jgi:hypothetical protein
VHDKRDGKACCRIGDSAGKSKRWTTTDEMQRVRRAICFSARNAIHAIDIDANRRRIALAFTHDRLEGSVMKCRLCSQQLPRPGRLCRECERELERARHADVVVGDLAAVVTRTNADANARSGWTTKLRAPRNVIALAFCVGVAGAGSAVFVQHDSSRTHRSVMLDFAPAPAAHADVPARDAFAMRGEPSATTAR